MKPMQTLRRCARLTLGLSTLALLLSCAALPDKPARSLIYDFGPGPLNLPLSSAASTQLPTITLGEIEAPASLDSSAMLYRLIYANATQLQPYALARWSMPPAQLLRQRLREGLESQRPVLNPSTHPSGLVLRLELEEFAQLFDTPERSSGSIRLRATLLRVDGGVERLLGQRRFAVQRPAASADAPGGVRALASATDAAIQELAHWLPSMR